MTPALIEARAVTLPLFPEAQPFDLKICAAERWLISGGAGSGKSTLIKTLLGLIPPQSGNILLAGTGLRDLPPAGLLAARRGIGAVFSASGLIPAWTGLDNLALPIRLFSGLSEADADARVESFVSDCALPTAWLARSAALLSREEAALLALARALIINPSLLVIDNSLLVRLLAHASTRLGNRLVTVLDGGCTLLLAMPANDISIKMSLPGGAPLRHIRIERGSLQFDVPLPGSPTAPEHVQTTLP